MNIKFPDTYTVFDFETSGLDPKTDKIIEIGVVLVQDNKIVSSQSTVLKQPIQLSQEIIDITGITQEEVDKGEDPELSITQLLWTLVGIEQENGASPNLTHNGIKFDLPFLFNAMTQKQRDEHMDNICRGAIDTAMMYKGDAINEPRYWNETFVQYARRVGDIRAFGVKFNVAHCCKELGVDIEGVKLHRALADATLTHEIYQKLKTKNS